jgi:hypothetical protein
VPGSIEVQLIFGREMENWGWKPAGEKWEERNGSWRMESREWMNSPWQRERKEMGKAIAESRWLLTIYLTEHVFQSQVVSLSTLVCPCIRTGFITL